MTASETDDQGHPRIFVSYARDDRARAQLLVEALQQRGYPVWWDGLLGAGERFAPAIEAELEGAGTVIVLWSAKSVRSHWVLDEASRGRDRGCLVPVSLDGTEAPLGFRQLQSLDLSRWKGRADAPEVTAIVEAIGRHACAPRHAAIPSGPRMSRRAAVGAGTLAVAAIGALAAWRGGWLGGTGQGNSIAVLPFRNLSADPGQDYFSDGLAEELRATLSLTPGLDVAAQTSSDSFRGGGTTAAAIARALDVAWILEGSVRRSGGRMRIAAQLVDGASGFEKWSQTFERAVGDALDVQGEIAVTVADALSAKLADGSDGSGGTGRRVGGTDDPAAFDDFLRGSALYQSAAGKESDRAALEAFDRAIARDANYAAAHAARSRVLTYIAGNYVQGGEIEALIGKALAAAQQAIALAPDLAEGHSALGFALMNGRLDLEAADAPYRRSYDLGFGNAPILSQFATYATNIGDFASARRAIERAQRLDPLNDAVFRNAAISAYSSGDFALAAKDVRRALAINPQGGASHRILGDIAIAQGRFDEAASEFGVERSALSRLRGLAIVEFGLQGADAGERRLAELARTFGDAAHFQQAEVLAQWGRTEEAFAQLDLAWKFRDPGLVWLAHDPLLDPLRQDPRFAAMLDRLGVTAGRPAAS